MSIRTPASAPAPAPERPARSLGLPQATALIVGSIIGVGIFNLPSPSPATAPSASGRWSLTTVGALALALMFAAMSRRLPADGGPYAYARAAFGNGIGFANAWSYWITAWAGNAAIVVGWVFYVEAVRQHGATRRCGRSLIALVGLWIPAAINLIGVKNMGAVQLWTIGVKFVPLVFMSTVGLFFSSTAQLQPVERQRRHRPVGDRRRHGALPVQLPRRRDGGGRSRQGARPRRNVPRATVFGTLASAVVYLLSLIAVFGIGPERRAGTSQRRRTPRPPTPCFGGTWAGYLVVAAASSSPASAPSTAGP